MPHSHRSYDASELDPSTGEPMIRFGDWLVRRGLIGRDELEIAMRSAAGFGCRVGDALVNLELLDRACVEQEAIAHRNFTAFHRPSHLTAVLFEEIP